MSARGNTAEASFYQALGQRIMSARLAKNITQSELAGKLSIHKSTMSNYEWGKTRVPLAEFVVLARVLRVDPLWLLLGVGDQKGSEW
jgi:transcriptional regulator with XRE-family HTH domain